MGVRSRLNQRILAFLNEPLPRYEQRGWTTRAHCSVTSGSGTSSS
jgi:hypothetical protein